MLSSHSLRTKDSKPEFIDYFQVLLLVAVSGVPFFYISDEFIVFGVIIAFFRFISTKAGISGSVIAVFSLFGLVEFAQVIYFQNTQLITLAGTYARLLLAFLIFSNTKDKFASIYVRLIYVAALVSLFFFTITLIPQIGDFLLNSVAPLFKSPFYPVDSFYSEHRTIIVYNVEHIHTYRNSGPFWEPGAFAIFLVIAQLFRFRENNFFDKVGLVLFISVITTLSTSGFLAEFLLLIFYITRQKNFGAKLIIPVIVLVGLGVYTEFDFMEEKIQRNIEVADYNTASRFGSAVADLRDFENSPIIGWGRGENRFGGMKYASFTREFHRNNGLSDLLVTYGLIIFVFYLYRVFKSFRIIAFPISDGGLGPFIFLFVLMILGFSQGIFMRPFFLAFLFIPSLITDRNK